MVQQVGFIDLLDYLCNGSRLLLLTGAKSCGIEVNISEQICKDRIGLLHMIECLFEHFTLKSVLACRFCKFSICKLRLDSIVVALLDVLQKFLGIFGAVNFFVCCLCFCHRFGLFVIEKVINVCQECIGQILIEYDSEKIVLIFISVHFTAQNICTSPKNAQKVFTVFVCRHYGFLLFSVHSCSGTA